MFLEHWTIFISVIFFLHCRHFFFTLSSLVTVELPCHLVKPSKDAKCPPGILVDLTLLIIQGCFCYTRPGDMHQNTPQNIPLIMITPVKKTNLCYFQNDCHRLESVVEDLKDRGLNNNSGPPRGNRKYLMFQLQEVVLLKRAIKLASWKKLASWTTNVTSTESSDRLTKNLYDAGQS